MSIGFQLGLEKRPLFTRRLNIKILRRAAFFKSS